MAPAEAPGYVVEFRGSKVPAGLAARVEALGGRIDFVSQPLAFALVSGLDEAAATALATEAGVGDVYEDAVVQLATTPRVGLTEALTAGGQSIANPAAGIRFGYQWNMRQIEADVAWANGYLGSPDVTVAILDSGIDYDGYDMNGQVDLARSASFVPNDDAILAALFPGRHVIDDLNGHGSNVASQVSSNALIFAGVNSMTRLIGVKVLGYNGSGSISGILAGLAYAADQGAAVANLSLGIRDGWLKAQGGGLLVGLTNKAFNYAKARGVTVVVSAGNDAANMDRKGVIFEAFCEAPHVICVSATGPSASADPFSGPWTNPDAPADYSNYGRQAISVAAPGGTGYGYVSSVCARHLMIVSGGGLSFPCDAPPGYFAYIGFIGTSQAAPHVAGLAAKLVERYGKNPALVKQALIRAVDDLGPRGKDAAYGFGRINVAKAVGL